MSKPLFPSIYPDIRPFGPSGFALVSDPSSINKVKWVYAGGISTTGINDLLDVDVTGAASGDFLQYNGSAWIDVSGVRFSKIMENSGDVYPQYIYNTPLTSSRNTITPAADTTALRITAPTVTTPTEIFVITNGPIALALEKTANSPHAQNLYFNGTDALFYMNRFRFGSSGNTGRYTDIRLSLDTPASSTGIFFLPSGMGPSGYGLITDGRNNIWAPVSASLSGLLDVDITGAASGDYLKYNGIEWVDAQIPFDDIRNGVNGGYLVTTGTILPSGGGIIDANRYNNNAIIALEDGGLNADASMWSSGAILFKRNADIGVNERILFIDYGRGHVAVGSGIWSMGSGNAPRAFLTLGAGTSKVAPFKFTSSNDLITSPVPNDVGSLEFLSASGLSYINSGGVRRWLLNETTDINDIVGVLDVSKGGTSVTGFNEGALLFTSGNSIQSVTGILSEGLIVQRPGTYPKFLEATSSGYMVISNGTSWQLIPQGSVLASGQNVPYGDFVLLRPTGFANNDVLTVASSGHGLILRSRPEQTAWPLQVRASGSNVAIAGIGPSGILYATSGIYLHQNSAILAYPSGSSVIRIGSNNGLSSGGIIDISSTGSLNAGNIYTKDGGGTIDTQSGYIQFGLSTLRTTLQKSPALVTTNTLNLPTGDGNIALYENVLSLRPNSVFRNRIISQKPEVAGFYFIRATGDQNTQLFTIDQQTGENIIDFNYFYDPNTARLDIFDSTPYSIIRLYGQTNVEFYNSGNIRPVILQYNSNTPVGASGAIILLPPTGGTLALLSDIPESVTGVFYNSLSSGNYLRFNGDEWVNITQIDHGELFGLNDDDHSIYLHIVPDNDTRNIIEVLGVNNVGLTVQLNSGEFVQSQYPLLIKSPDNEDILRITNTFDHVATGSILTRVDLFNNVSSDFSTSYGRVNLYNAGYVTFNNFGNTRSISLLRPAEATGSFNVYLPSGAGNLKTIELTTLGDLSNVSTTVDSATSGHILRFDGSGWLPTPDISGGGGGGVTDHGALTGLADDDHPNHPLMTGITADRNIFQGTTSSVVPIDIRTPNTLGSSQRLFNVNYANSVSAMNFNVTNSNTSVLSLGSGAIFGGQPCNIDLRGQFNFYGFTNASLSTSLYASAFQYANATVFFNPYPGNQVLVTSATVSNTASGFVFMDTAFPASGKVFASLGNGIYGVDPPAASLALNDLTDVNVAGATSGQALVYNGIEWVDHTLRPNTRCVYCYFPGGVNAFQSFTANQTTLVTGHFTANAGGIEYDPFGWYDKSTGELKFQPDVSGLYELSLRLVLTSFSAISTLRMLKNGALYCTLDTRDNVGTTTPAITAGGSTMIPLNGNTDYVTFDYNHNDTSTRTVNTNGGAIFTAKLIDASYA